MKKNSLAITALFLLLLTCSSCLCILICKSTQPTTAILGALDEEVRSLQEQLTNRQEQKIENIRFVTGNLRGKKIVIACTGVAKVNAAITTTLLIEHFRPNEVIFTGIAGAINPQLFPGDVVIATRTAQHDLGILSDENIQNIGVRNPIDKKRNPVFFDTDPQLLQLAIKASETEALEKVNKRTPKIIQGIIITGDIFVSSSDKGSELRKRLGADAVEMEGAAVAQICYQRKIPFIIVRGISDRAGKKALQDADIYLKIAANNAAILAAKIVELLNQQPSHKPVGQK